MKTLFYVPLEPYKERYTVQLSAPGIGWLERRWLEYGVNYKRIEGNSLNKEIKVGNVLDACGRGYWSNSQIMNILQLLNENKITDEDVIYFDDFWHPGISALPYAFHLLGVKPRMYAVLYAQSIDVYDFTYPMRYWMRDFEKGIGKVLDGIFVTSTCLKDLCIYAGIGTEEKIHVCGLPYNSDEVETHLPSIYPERKKQVIFTSRWDKEKRPDVFLRIVDECVQKRNDIHFLITTSTRSLKSNNIRLLNMLDAYLEQFPDNLTVRVGLSKDDYYYNLLESKIQINTADQDFVSWTLLEATTCGCRPLYPNYLSFPEALQYNYELMYNKNDIQDAVSKIIRYIDEETDKNWDWIYKPFDKSWQRMMQVMKKEQMNDSLYSNTNPI